VAQTGRVVLSSPREEVIPLVGNFGDGFRRAIEQERAQRAREAEMARRIADRIQQEKLAADLRRQTQQLRTQRIWREMQGGS
jgi:hypothetical protein